MTTQAIEITAPDHPVKSVTVFKASKAEIVRTFDVDIKAGKTKICIKELPSSLDANYVRLSTSSGDVQVLDVVSSVATEYNDPIRELRVKKAGLESEKMLRDHEADWLVSYARTLSSEHVPPDQVSTFLEDFVEKGKENIGALTTLAEEIFAIERSIREQTGTFLPKQGNSKAQVSVVLASEDPQKIVLKLTYIVSGLQWRPTYEMHATSVIPSSSTLAKSPKLASVTLYYRALLAQGTGEDWSGASITLSTSAPFPSPFTFSPTPQVQWHGQKGLPRLVPLKLRSERAPPFWSNAPQSIFGPHRGQGPTFGGAPAGTNTNAGGGLFGSVPASGATGTHQQPIFGQSSFPPSTSSIPAAFGGTANGGNGGNSGGSFSAFGSNQSASGGTAGLSQRQDASANANNKGSAFGFGAFGSTQPAQASSAFGSSQPAQAFSAFGSAPSQPQPQPSAPGFGTSSNSQQPPTFRPGFSFGPSTTNNIIAPGFGVFNQPSGFGSGGFGSGGFGSSTSQQPSQNSGSAFGQNTSAPATSGFTQPTTSQGFGGGAFGSFTSQQPSQNSGSAFGQNTSTPATSGFALPTTSQGFGAFSRWATQQQHSSGGLFGSTAPATPFGGTTSSTTTTTTTNTPSAGVGSLFENISNTQQQGSSSGGLSRATTSTPSSAFVGASLLGDTSDSQPQQQQSSSSGGLLGSGAKVPGPGFGGGSLFGNTSNTQQQQQQGSSSGGLLGATTSTPSSAFVGASLLGDAGDALPQQQQSSLSGGLFGSGTKVPGSGFGGGSLFGNTSNTQQQHQQGSSSGGLFGATTNAPSSGFGNGSLFGNTSNTQPQSQQSSSLGGLFGSGTKVPGSGFGSLFGDTSGTQPQQQQSSLSGGLFGSGANATGSGFGNGSLFGNSSNTQQQHQQNLGAGGLFGAFPPLGPFPTPASASIMPVTLIKNNTSPAGSCALQVQHGGDIPSDGVEHQVTIASIPLKTERVERVCFPRVGGQVWLHCHVKNTSEYRLLAGPANVVLNDSYVSRVNIDDVSLGDTFTCTLGDDPEVHLSYTLTTHVVLGSAQNRFSDPLATTTFTSKAVLWNKHEWAVRNVVVKDVVPVPEESPFTNYHHGKVILRKPEGLADVREGTEVQVGVEVLHSQDEKEKEKRRVDVNVKGEESETEYVQVEEKDKEAEEKGKGKRKETEMPKKQVKVMWEKSVDGMGGEKEGRFEWRIEEIGAGERVVLEAQWEVRGESHIRWFEVAA